MALGKRKELGAWQEEGAWLLAKRRGLALGKTNILSTSGSSAFTRYIATPPYPLVDGRASTSIETTLYTKPDRFSLRSTALPRSMGGG